MSDLDDAIRAHLELRRQHGADPREVARQAEEALGSGSYEAEPNFAAERYAALAAEPPAAYAPEPHTDFAPEHHAEVHTLAEHAQSRASASAYAAPAPRPLADTAAHAAPAATTSWGRAQLDGDDATQEFSIEELDFGWVGSPAQQLRSSQRAS